MLNRRLAIVLALSLGLAASAPALAQDKSIVVASTTSTQDSACSVTFCRCSRQKAAST